MPFWLLDSVAFEGNDYSYWKILGIFILIWTNDSMAYFTGKFLGKKKLFERISPNKTWIGFFGGLIFSVIASYILSMYKSFYPVWMWLSIGVLVPVVGTYGDLIQSMWKRHFNLKDSGNMLPGHGGFYDRFDSFILIVPHVFIIEHLLWVF